MTTAANKSKPAWQAEVRWRKRHYTTVEPAPKGELDETADGEGPLAPPEGTAVEIEHHGVREYFIHVSRPGCEPISFRVNHRAGRDVTFSDPRESNTGVAGVTGIWGTRPAPPVYKPRPLQQFAFRAELARLIGAEQAEEIVRTVLSQDFFDLSNDNCHR